MASAIQYRVMSPVRLVAAVAIVLTSTASCGSPTDAEDTQTKQAYQLCPISIDALAKLNEIATSFAAEQQAKVYDRGAEAQRELASMDHGSDTLRSTNLPLILLTIEKPSVFRVSITNAGLQEKIAVTVRIWKETDGDSRTEALISQLGSHWSIDKAPGGILNDPPCPTL